MELVSVTNGQIEVQEKVLAQLELFNQKKKEMDKLEKEMKQSILKAMEENGIKSFENDLVKMTYCGATTRTSVDTQILKDMGIYDSVLKESSVKASVRVTWK